MVKLKVVKVDKFDEYVLEDDKKKQHFLSLGFYDMPKLEVGDVIYLQEAWLNTKSLNFVHSLYFAPINENEKDVKESDLIGICTKGKNLVIKRVYGWWMI